MHASLVRSADRHRRKGETINCKQICFISKTYILKHTGYLDQYKLVITLMAKAKYLVDIERYIH